ncbi:glycosyltransferase [Limnobacter alexandrii]|uniref:glycosyltransferase n=1 Tax=Limnobacter alexandrii TaxID=2570352 RepID=UPI00110994D0|nr:glycosyltransferase [Limnobacter alexandrii]
MMNSGRLEKLGKHLEALCSVERKGNSVLMLSHSNGIERATVEVFVGQSFEASWRALHAHVSESFRKSIVDAEHVRVDWVCDIQAMTWAELKKLLSNTKRNYFSHGIALDPQFRHAFLWGELNGNAMLYGGSEEEFAKLSVGNFEKYARKKYGKSFVLNHDDAQPVYLFSTQGAYVGTDGVVHTLEPAGVAVGRRKLPNLDAESCQQLVFNASEFLARQVKDSGVFVYGMFPCFNKEIPTYNTLRHASSTYAMIEAWELTQSALLKSAIDRSLHCLTNDLIKHVTLSGGIQAAFLVDTGNEIKLGGNAVCILALAKYTELTGDTRYIELMEQLAQGIVAMLNPTTRQFVHVLNYPDLSVKEQFRIIYYDGEAAFALMRLYKITRRPMWLQAVELAFEYFIEARHWKANDHWMSYCVNELTLYRPKRVYFEFGIRNFSNHLDFVLDRITTFPTLLELMMAAEQMLSRLQGMPEFADLYAQVDVEKFYRAMHWRANYLLTGYFWPEWAMYFAKPDTLNGAFFIRHHAYRVRIDDVEHYVSGLVAYRKFLLKPVKQLSVSSIREPGRLNSSIENTQFWFLNQDMGFQRSGVENAALLRSRLFVEELNKAPVLVTSRFNPRLHESIQGLKVACRSIYDYLQDAETAPVALNTGQSIERNPLWKISHVEGRRDFRVAGPDGHLLMYVVRHPTSDAILHINHFGDGLKLCKEIFDSRGHLSCIQYLNDKGAPTIEHYLRPNGTVALVKIYRTHKGKMTLQNIRVCGERGELKASFSSEEALITHALTSMLKQAGGKHVLVVDKNRYWYKPAIAARDVVHQTTPHSIAVVPVIHALHTQTVRDLHVSPVNSNFKDILADVQQPDAIVTLTNSQKIDIQSRFGEGRIFSIGHAYEPDRSVPSFDQRDRFRIVCMARYSPEKNHQLAIAAFARLTERYPQARLDFYGFPLSPTNQLVMALREQIQTLGLVQKVRLNGWVDDPAVQYRSAGLSLLTSQAEAFSLTIMESLCHACPPVAFDVPYGPSQLIQHAGTGMLVPFGDVDALAKAIDSIFADPVYHAQLSAQALLDSNRFKQAEVATHWRGLLSSLGVGEVSSVKTSLE